MKPQKETDQAKQHSLKNVRFKEMCDILSRQQWNTYSKNGVNQKKSDKVFSELLQIIQNRLSKTNNNSAIIFNYLIF